jgi:regulator of PEP synthase PpsR (kinase-PPPase family)
MEKQLNLHLISDSTGETVSFIAKAVLSQFPDVKITEFHHFLIKNQADMQKVIASIEENKGIVLHSVVNPDVKDVLDKISNIKDVFCIPAVSRIAKQFADFWGIKSVTSIGGQHTIDEEYYKKMDAINYTLAHDDGNLVEDLHDADIIIIGVSRSSKSPTSIYLGYKGYKVGNIPFVRAELIPEYIKTLTKPLIVGFTIDPERLKAIRNNRLKTLDAHEKSQSYADIMEIKKEILEAKKYLINIDAPVINVTEKSIEETSVMIIKMLEERCKL